MDTGGPRILRVSLSAPRTAAQEKDWKVSLVWSQMWERVRYVDFDDVSLDVGRDSPFYTANTKPCKFNSSTHQNNQMMSQSSSLGVTKGHRLTAHNTLYLQWL